ncbi:MAG: hypothetical protein ACP5FT_04560 [Acidilobus sp.]
MSLPLRDQLEAAGYVDLGYDGVGRLMVRPGGSPLCINVVEDWPMLLLFRSARGYRASLQGRAAATFLGVRVVVRRADDLRAVGEATITDGGLLSPQPPCTSTWCLGDYLTPNGLDVPSRLASLLRLTAPYVVRLVRAYTSPVTGVVLREGFRGRWPFLGPYFSDVKLPFEIDLPVGLDASSPQGAEEALAKLRALAGRGC